MGDHVRVEIFDDRIEIESPGRFAGLVDPTNPLAATGTRPHTSVIMASSKESRR